MAEEEGARITVTVKTPKEKHDVEVSADIGVKEFKLEVSKKFSAPLEQLCLIFAGKILKDGDTLAQHGIKDGLTVHLVIKSLNRSQEQAAQRSAETTGGGGSTRSETETPNLTQTPFGLGGLGGLTGLGNLGMGSHNFMQMQQNMQREMMANPDMMRQMMDNPFVQQLMSNPDVMRQMIMSNPQMRELMERNPEISHMLNNPELMRQTMELARNPAMLQELMRSQDRAMSNLESIPGGFNALQRMYRDVQEPMMDAAFGNQNPFSSLVNQGSESNTTQQGTENTDPLPNPWAPASTQSSTSTTQSSTSTTPSTDMFNSRGIQSLMQQMTQNPQLMENMLQAPYMQAMLQSMSANPEMANQVLNMSLNMTGTIQSVYAYLGQIIGSNPMFAGNPQLQQHMQQQLPAMLQQLQNPEMQALLTNPQALQAISQIQQGMSTLQQTAPTLFPGLNPAATSLASLGGTPATSTTSSSTETSSTDTSTTSTATSTTASTTSTPSQQNPEQLSNLMAHMMQMMAGGNVNQPPEQRYASQLDQLATMGFVDREANIRALQATLGDVNAAIDRLLQQR